MNVLETRQFYRCRATGEISSNFVEVLPKALILDPNYHRRAQSKYLGELNTLFREVEIVPPNEVITPEMKKLFALKQGTIQMTKTQLFNALENRLAKVIETSWNSHLDHIVMHSSGRDSRILSWLIRKLYLKNGPEWLGKIIFLCSYMEGPPFEEIMRFEGWKKHQYLVVGRGMKPEEVIAPVLLDFKNAWEKCNGSFLDPLNMFVYFPEVAHKKLGFPIDNVQMWTGFFGGELAYANEPGVHPSGKTSPEVMFEHLYWIATYSSRQMMGEAVTPYTDLDYIQIMLESSIRLGSQHLRNELMASLNPKLIEFDNWNHRGHRRFPVTEKALDQALRDYRKSWYGKSLRSDLIWPENALKKSRVLWPMNSFWAIASLCEYLLKEGYEIRLEPNYKIKHRCKRCGEFPRRK